ncbi:MAG: hypothetical protein HRU34_18260 [Richelia sp.]|nr:hypothetical protein [Richelia sp.]CDN12172.1 hypothetical protein RintRC_7129 [Richelia intracellularis]
MRDDFTNFSTSYQWFKTLIHPALMQRRLYMCNQDNANARCKSWHNRIKLF